ncbi:MAG: RluA family pseudouridine synthase [Myxococcales bacterium]|nr:RluA family pseudouridine synthase [Myxococcales bacterium]
MSAPTATITAGVPMSNDKLHIIDEGAPRLDHLLVSLGLVTSRRRASQVIQSGKVDVNGQVATAGGMPLPPGASVQIDWNRKGTGRKKVTARAVLSQRQIGLVHEDADVLVLNKPAGMLTDTATAGQERAKNSLRHYAELYLRHQHVSPFVVHRIDRDTSGLVLFAKSTYAGKQLKEQFARRTPRRVYWCAVQGSPETDSGTFEHWMAWNSHQLIQQKAVPNSKGAVLASAQWRVLSRQRDITLLEVRLHTGRRNQIRLHCQLNGWPLVGEKQYVDEHHRAKGPRLRRQALHALRLAFSHPQTGATLAFEAPLPADISNIGARKSKNKADAPAAEPRKTPAASASDSNEAPPTAADSTVGATDGQAADGEPAAPSKRRKPRRKKLAAAQQPAVKSTKPRRRKAKMGKGKS